MKSILIIDDDDDSLKTACHSLSSYYRIIAVNSGEKALNYLKNSICNMILLDLHMPGINGIDTLKRLKSNKETKGIPVIILTEDKSESIQSKCLDLGADDFVLKPFRLKIMLRRIAHVIELYEYRKRMDEIIEAKTEQVKIMQHSLILSFAKIIESRDTETGDHINRTKKYVKMIVSHLRNDEDYKNIIDDSYVNTIVWSAPLHDIGKIGIPDHILLKPGRLTCNEFDKMKKHTLIGAKIIADTLKYFKNDAYLEMAKDMALYHHEKWEGTGYPYGLSKEEIPLSARIMAVADVFDACTSKRCYKDAMSVKEALDVLKQGMGSQFDPKVVKAFLSYIDQIKMIVPKNN